MGGCPRRMELGGGLEAVLLELVALGGERAWPHGIEHGHGTHEHVHVHMRTQHIYQIPE